MKPLIGVVPLWDSEKNSLWMLLGYMQGIERAGGIPVMLPLSGNAEDLEQVCQTVDGLLFTGGHDVSPSLYGEEKSALCQEICEARDTMEENLFTNAIERDIPAFGICRGIQIFNVLLGGTLHQHMDGHSQQPPYDKPSHSVQICRESPLHFLLKADNIAVNSYHHQGIKKLSPKLSSMAYAEDLAEAVYMPGKKFVWAVQWHPELSLDDENSVKLFNAFMDACRG